MPSFMQSLFETKQAKPVALIVHEPRGVTGGITLPPSGWAAILRGLRGQCPRCGEGGLFLRFLKPIPRCPQCGQDWTHQQADDFPAYVSILVTGHLMVPLVIALTRDTALSVTALATIVMPLAIILMAGLLQPAKGAIIALQWWFGMHGFRMERAATVPDNDE
jgi:uncharacterized protein (DUF983 family)